MIEAFAVGAAAFCVPLLVSWHTTKALIRWAPTIGLVDRPGVRKSHARVTPLGGGLALYGAVASTLGLVELAAWLVGRFPAVAQLAPPIVRLHAAGVRNQAGLVGLLVGAATVQLLVGLIDDYRRDGLDYRLRLGVEVALVSALALYGVRLSLFTDSLWVTVPVTVLWVVGLTNALNFLDNMDALSAGVTFIASAFFVVLALMTGNLFVAGCFLTLLGALLGFLRFNWNPAKIFMGDAGSNFLGFWLGTLTVVGTYHTAAFDHVTIFAPLCVLAVPIYDSTSVILLRILQGGSPFQADKQHFSHRLVELGFRPKNAVLLIYLVSTTTGLGALLLYFLEPVAAPLVILQVACMLGVIALLEVASWRRNTRQARREDDSEVPA